MKQDKFDRVFDYKALRLLIGVIAFSLPIAVIIFSTEILQSISASYYTESRDLFVGMLTIVGALMFAYKGSRQDKGKVAKYSVSDATASKFACVSALLVAFFPTGSDQCNPELNTILECSGITNVIHYCVLLQHYSGFLLTSAWWCFKRALRARVERKGFAAKYTRPAAGAF